MTGSEHHPITSTHPSLGNAFAATAARAPDGIVIAGDGPPVTRARLDERSRSLAGALATRGLGRGDRVMLALGRGADFVTAALGVARAGAAYVPVDPRWPAMRLAELAEIVRPAAVIGTDAGPLFGGSTLPTDTVSGLVASGQPDASGFTDRAVGPETPLYVMFTSGTTGVPKAVVIPHRAVQRLVLAPDYMESGPDRVWLQLAATSFDAATLEIWAPLVQGGTIVPVTDGLPTLEQIAETIAREGVTDAWLTASLFNAVVDHRIDAFAGMKQVLTGGERLSPAHVGRFLERWPGIRLVNGYGPTENTTFTCCHTIRPSDCASQHGIPIGLPIGGTTVRIVNEYFDDAAPGERGELLAGGDGLALGYLDDDALTASRFVTPEAGGETWYRTGDLVERAGPGAPISFIGRLDRQVKIRGHRIELEDVERTLRAHPDVGEAYAFTVGDSADTRRLVAGCTRRVPISHETGAQGIDAIRAWALQRVEEFSVPDEIVVLEHVPVGPNGKADREAVLRMVLSASDQEPASQAANPEHWDEFRGLLTETLPGTSCRPADGFLEVGGHSIAALRLAAMVQERWGIRLGVGEILRCEALGTLAARLAEAPLPVDAHTPPVHHDAKPSASSIQRQFFFENAVDPTGVAYHEYAAFRIGAPGVDMDRLEGAFRALIARHEALRTRIVMVDDGLVQEIEPPTSAASVPITLHGVVDWPEGGEIPDAVWIPITQPFDLERHLPARMDVFQVASGGHAAVLTFQHASVDEWSLGIIEREFAALYSDPDALGGEPTPYRVFSSLEESEVSEASVVEAADRLLGADHPQVPLGHAPAEAVSVDDALLDDDALRSLAERFAATPTAALVGIYATALAEVFGLGRVAMLTPVSHRSRPVLQGVVGCCNTMHPLVIDASVGGRRAPLSAVIASASDAILGAYESDRVPFEHVAMELHRRGTGSVAPVPFGFAFETNAPFRPDLPGLDTAPLPIRGGVARFPIGLSIDRRDGALRAILSAPIGLGADATLGRIHDAMRRNIESALTGDEPDGSFTETEQSAPTTVKPVEETENGAADARLRGIATDAWRDLLGHPPASDTARFFDQGGHSLLLLRLAARIRTETGIEIPLAAFLKDPTFGKLVALLASGGHDPRSDEAGFQIEELGTGRRVVIGVPGAFGRPISFQHVAEAFEAGGHDIRIRCYNVFDAMSDGDITRGFDLVLDRLARDFARPETVGMLGFCAGGLYPLFMDAIPAAHRARNRLWMLNVFAPDQADEAMAQRMQSVREALSDFRSLPRACVVSAVTLARMAAVRLRGSDAGVSADDFSQAEFRRLLSRGTLKPWHGRSTVIIAGRKPVWRTYYRNDRLNGLADYLQGPRRTVVLPLLHHQLLTNGATRLAEEIAADIESDAADQRPGHRR